MNTTELVKERGKSYGSPKPAWALIRRMYGEWETFRDAQEQLPPEEEQAFRHGIYMLLVKMSRLAVTPNHQDSLADIKGYAQCIEEVFSTNSFR